MGHLGTLTIYEVPESLLTAENPLDETAVIGFGANNSDATADSGASLRIRFRQTRPHRAHDPQVTRELVSSAAAHLRDGQLVSD